jgi:hypothetical protein
MGMDIFVLKVSFIKYTFAITIWSPKQTNVNSIAGTVVAE